eukprot:TRINITY_DN5125_c0_g1_i5.p2 TRINITY_DN5125_c0_g1~~TRINITY_DN5125_c0_g1_i5.p2  ORF type:complete len:227 (-),score=-2.10 TRINITY_DN5125_c0_g1_i5:538-1218(-)
MNRCLLQPSIQQKPLVDKNSYGNLLEKINCVDFYTKTLITYYYKLPISYPSIKNLPNNSILEDFKWFFISYINRHTILSLFGKIMSKIPKIFTPLGTSLVGHNEFFTDFCWERKTQFTNITKTTCKCEKEKFRISPFLSYNGFFANFRCEQETKFTTIADKDSQQMRKRKIPNFPLLTQKFSLLKEKSFKQQQISQYNTDFVKIYSKKLRIHFKVANLKTIHEFLE